MAKYNGKTLSAEIWKKAEESGKRIQVKKNFEKIYKIEKLLFLAKYWNSRKLFSLGTF